MVSPEFDDLLDGYREGPIGRARTCTQPNDLEHAANAQVVDVLSRCVGERLPVDREACRRWWFKRLGQTPIGRSESLHPTLTEMVPLDYLPRNVGGLGFDPVGGYFLIVPAAW